MLKLQSSSMKYYQISIFIILFIGFSFSSYTKINVVDKRTQPYERQDITFKIYQIDSINNYYIVYAKRHDSLYKIVAQKTTNSNCSKIEIGKNYRMTLYSIWTKPLIINGVDVSLSSTPHVTCLGFDDSTSICIDRANGIFDLFTCRNLNGLCYLP